MNEDDAAQVEIQEHIDKGHILQFDTVDELKETLGKEHSILNKIGLVRFEKEGVKKNRLIRDNKRSGLKYSNRKCQRVILPRLMDVILQILTLMPSCGTFNFDIFELCRFQEMFDPDTNKR